MGAEGEGVAAGVVVVVDAAVGVAVAEPDVKSHRQHRCILVFISFRVSVQRMY